MGCKLDKIANEEIIELPKHYQICIKWRNGYWYNKNEKQNLIIIDGNKMTIKDFINLDYTVVNGTWTYGDFGPADEEIFLITGFKNYNLEINYGYVFCVTIDICRQVILM